MNVSSSDFRKKIVSRTLSVRVIFERKLYREQVLKCKISFSILISLIFMSEIHSNWQILFKLHNAFQIIFIKMLLSN